MAFDYGSIDLGLRNPFKTEGKITAARGVIQTLLGLFLLITAASKVKDNPIDGWILMIFGVFLLSVGIKVLAGGIYAILRYFVGRNHPTSLAQNYSKSEASTAQEEASYVGYNVKTLEEMLVGRKNATFLEPQGFLARLLHTLIPKLLFMPYPIRNMTQRLFSAWVNTLVALIAYGFVAFVTLAGFAGKGGALIFPIYSALLMFYLLISWRSAGKPIARNAEKQVESLGGGSLVKIISVSVILPVVIGLLVSWFITSTKITNAEIDHIVATFPGLHTSLYLIAIFVLAAFSSVVVFMMLRRRLSIVEPSSEVSELRENWQESVHPNEIFINLDNLVMANRRYKEVPNRIYRELDPQLQEQINGKGGFKGEMIQEIQPKVKPMELGEGFNKTRLLALISGSLLFILSTVCILLLSYKVVGIYEFTHSAGVHSLKAAVSKPHFFEFANLVMAAFHLVLISFLVKSFAKLLVNAAHLYYAEIQFESLLVYFKCEGTFTESKISTGTGIHDSTRSENTMVRSSITPWVIVSKIISTTFAATGMRNMEHPRYVLEMHKDDSELASIRKDVIAFLKDRETIAAITSERDLGNASQIYQLNQQTRAMPDSQSLEHDAEAAGYLRQQSEAEQQSEGENPVDDPNKD